MTAAVRPAVVPDAVGHFRALGKASGDAYWMEAVAATQTSIADIQSGLTSMQRRPPM